MPDHIPPPSTLPPGSSVWAYLRDSGGPSQDRSVGQQKAEIEEYCKHYNLGLSLVFADIARSGGSTTAREQFNEMIDMSQHHVTRPDGILIWNYARFARDLDDSQYYKATLRGITIHSLQIQSLKASGQVVSDRITIRKETPDVLDAQRLMSHGPRP
jgi:DNA invertase Pin-like site-specific DNA recombinase